MPTLKEADMMVSDWDTWEKTLDEPRRAQLESIFRFETDREAARKRFAAVTHISAATGADLNDVSRRFESFYMPNYAAHEKGLNKPEGVKDANEFYNLLQSRSQNNLAKIELFNDAADAALSSALKGGDDLADFAAWQVGQDNEEAFGDKARQAWKQAREETLAALGQDGMAIARRGVRAMRDETGVAAEQDAWMNEARRDLIRVKAEDPKKYNLILAAMKAMGEGSAKEEKGIMQGMGESLARGVENIMEGAVNAPAIGSARLADMGITNAPDGPALATEIRAGLDVDADLRDLMSGVIDPVKSTREGWAKWAEDAAYQVSGSAPLMASYAVPGGALVASASFMPDAYRDFRQAGWTGAGAETAAVASGLFQGAVEGASELAMKIPGVAGVMAKFGVKPGSSWAAQFLIRSGVRGGIEVTEEVIQEATSPFIQELSAAIFDAVPDRPEGQKLKDVMGHFMEADRFMPLLLSVLPLGMVGAGLSTSRDMAIVEAVTQNRKLLRTVFSEEDAVAIESEADPVKRQALIQEKWVATPTAQIAERARAALEKEKQLMTEVSAAVETASKSPFFLIPKVRRDENGWMVQYQGPEAESVVRVASKEAAVSLAYDGYEENVRVEGRAMVDTLEAFSGAKDIFEVDLANELLLKDTGISEQQMTEAAIAEGIINGMTREEAQNITWAVHGQNRLEQVEGVRRVVSKLAAGANVLDAVEEPIEGKFVAALKSGRLKRDQAIAWVKIAAGVMNAPELVTAAESGERGLIEAVSDVVLADTFGKRRDGSKAAQGAISAGIRAKIRRGGVGKAETQLGQILASFRHFFGQVFKRARQMVKARKDGRIGEDFDAFLDTLMETDASVIYEREAAQEAVTMAGEVDNAPFSLSPAGMASDQGAAQNTAPSTGGLTESDAKYLAAVQSSDLEMARQAFDNQAGKIGRLVKDSKSYDFETGESVVALGFHGSKSQVPFTVFDSSKLGSNTHADSAKKGFFFAGSKDTAGSKDYYIRREFEASEEGERWVSDYKNALKSLLREAIETTSVDTVNDLPFGQYDIVTEWGEISIDNLLDGRVSDDVDYIISSRLDFLKDDLAPALEEMGLDAKDAIESLSGALPESYLDTTEGQMIEAYLILKNPLVFDDGGKEYREQTYSERIDEAIQNGHDSIVIKNTFDGGPMDTILVVLQSNQIKSADPVTRNDQGNIIPPSRRFDSGPDIRGDVSFESSRAEGGAFSLAPRSLASVADTVLASRMKKPEFREAFYGVARQKLASIRDQMDAIAGRTVDKTQEQWNREMKAREGFEYDRLLRENFGADTTQKQEALPAVDRQAARSEARTFAERWLEGEKKKQPTPKERQMAALRTLDAILSAFPPEIRGRVGGFVKLASLGTDKAREAEIVKRLDLLDSVVEKEAKKFYRSKIEDTFEKAKPKKGKAGEKPKGKLGAQTQAIVDLARTFSALDEAGVAAERAAIASKMSGEIDPGKMADLFEREQLLDLFGALDERTSAELEAAAAWLSETYDTGRNRWRAVIEQREGQTRAQRAQAREEIGLQGLDSEQQKALEEARTITKRAAGVALSWLSFEQVMTSILGRGSKLARDVVRQARAATTRKTDALREKRAAFKATMAGIFGTTKQREWQDKLWNLSQIGGVQVVKMEGARTETRTVAVEAVQRIIEGKASAKAFGLDALKLDKLADAWAENDSLPANRRKENLSFEVPMAGTATPTRLSQLQAVNITMLARQPGYTENMAGHGWTAEVLEEIENQLTPEAKAIRDWLAGEYRNGYDSLNEVYARMYGVNLPRLTNYSPGTFEAMDMMGQDIDPYGQGLLSEGGFRAGMLKTRGNHKAAPRLEDALSVYWSHVNATEHFKAFGEFARDLRGVMNNAEVRKSIKAKGGKDLLEAGQNWIGAFERNGVENRSTSSAFDEFIRRRQASQAYLALAYNMGTLMKQSTAALASLLNMGPGTAARQFAKLVSGGLDLKAAYNSEVIQRRMDAGYSPEVRQAMAAMMAERPSWGTGLVQKGMEIIGMVDAVFTTASYAMAYDYHLQSAKDAGMNDALAQTEAEREAEATVARTAQPSEMMDRSLFEMGLQPTGKFLFMFASEARQKAAIALEAYSPSSGLSKGERATRLLLLHVVFPLAIQTISNLWRDARDDDDDELFDSDNWRAGDYAKSMLLGPLMGIPLVGGALNAALTPLFGGHYFANDPTQPLNQAFGGGADILEAIQEGDLESGLKGARSLMWALALAMGGEKAAAVGAGTNILYDAFRVTENLVE